MAKLKNYILGLDVGVNSVGWAVVECQVEKTKEGSKVYNPTGIVDLNSRIFQEMTEAKTGVPKNQKRRTMRGMRRRMSRLRGRRQALIKQLQGMKLLPSQLDEKFFNQVAQDFAKRIAKTKSIQQQSLPLHYLMSPMLMRAYALDHRLEPYEFACALLQLQKRRGYKSNRGAKYDALYEYVSGEVDRAEEGDVSDDNEETKDDDGDTRKVLGGIEALKKEMESRDCRTIAEFVWHRACEEKKPLERITQYWAKDKKSGEVSLYAERSLYRKEFQAIWQAQAKQLKLNDKQRDKIQEIIFYQRPLLNPPPQDKRWKHLKYNDVGTCSFFPKEKRAAKALLVSQDYRTWQSISNIRINKDEKLSLEKKQLLAEALKDPNNLNSRGRLSWTKVKAIVGQETNYRADASESKQDANAGICGNRTELEILAILGDKWEQLDSTQKQKLVRKLVWTSDKVELYKELVGTKWKLSKGEDGEAFRLATLELEPGYMKHCLKVLKAVLQRMRDEGEDYYKACDHLHYHDKKAQTTNPSLSPKDIPSIANPRVQKGLYEIRKVVNAVIKKYGKPSLIRLELARDLKASKSHRRLIEWRQNQNRKLNEDADRELSEAMAKEQKLNRLTQTRQQITYLSATERKKYRMWKEQKQDCLYCGHGISINDLLDSAETEHIIPQSAFGQNYMNTVLACRTCNQQKGEKTPYQAWGETKQWGGIETRLKTKGKDREETCIKYPELPMAKVRRILTTKDILEDDDQFVQSQLNDTRYIAVTAKNILASLGVDVRITKGGAAALLRDLWGLGDVLPRHPDDVLTYDVINENTGEITKKDQTVLRRNLDEVKKSIGRDEIIKMNYGAKQAGEVKNRMDHRHHAIDAFIAAMTDNGLLIRLTRLGRLMRTKRFEEYRDEKGRNEKRINELEKAIKKAKQQIRQPDNWQKKGELLAKRIEDLLVAEKTVSHQNTNKIWGALHEETNYGQASYVTKFKLDTSSSTIKKLKKYLANDENPQGQNDEATWILRQAEREVIRDWVKRQELLKAKERSLPVLNGKTLTSIFLASRCYVVHKPVDKAIISKVTGKEWQEGTGSWIKDKEVHNQLRKWTESHKDNIEQGLKDDPPKMKSANGDGNVIKSVRIAYKFGRDSIAVIGDNRVYPLGSNHHTEIFTNDKKEKKGRVVSMKEAAERKNQKRSIINKEPSTEWEGGWEFSMSLSINDMVLWDKDDDRLNQDIKKLGTPIFRVQKISGDIIYFRHHSTSITSDSDIHALIRVSPSTLNCKKIVMDVLGNYQLLTE